MLPGSPYPVKAQFHVIKFVSLSIGRRGHDNCNKLIGKGTSCGFDKVNTI